MLKFRDIKTLQTFASVHASIFNHFNHDRHLNPRETFKRNKSAAPGRMASAGGLNARRETRRRSVQACPTMRE